MFMGTYEHGLDAKGRVIIPAKLREDLGESFVVTLGLDGCLFAYPMNEWEGFIEKLKCFRDISWQMRHHVNWTSRDVL